MSATSNRLELNKTRSRRSNRNSTSSRKDFNSNDFINYITFNQDASCVALGLGRGYKIFNCKPTIGKCYLFKKNESIGKIEMLYRTSLVALVGLGEEEGSSPRKLKLVNTKRRSTICDLVFSTAILKVSLTTSKMVVILEEQIYIYDIYTMKLLHTIETSSNSNGLCTLSDDNCDGKGNSYLAYPSPPKMLASDAFLPSGSSSGNRPQASHSNKLTVPHAPRRIGDVILFNLSTLQPISVIEAHKSPLAALALSKDGTLLATASDKGTIVRIFSVAGGAKLYQFRRGTYATKIFSLNFSTDNKYVLATSSSGTLHVFRLGEEESLKTRQQLRTIPENKGHVSTRDPIIEENAADVVDEQNIIENVILDEDDSESENSIGTENDDQGSSDGTLYNQRKLSLGSVGSYGSFGSYLSNEEQGIAKEPIIDQRRLSVARMIRRSSQTLGKKAAQKMGDYLPSRFSSILEPTRHFASLKIKSTNKDIQFIAVLDPQPQDDSVPQAYFKAQGTNINSNSTGTRDELLLSPKEFVTMKLLHISVVTSEGYFYVYGLDPERGGDCILLHRFYLLE